MLGASLQQISDSRQRRAIAVEEDHCAAACFIKDSQMAWLPKLPEPGFGSRWRPTSALVSAISSSAMAGS